MKKFLKSVAVLACLAGAAMAVSTPATADSFQIGVNTGRGDVIALGFGNVAFAYRDGYWDNAHRWHRWRNAREHRNYRRHYSSGYSNWNHDRDGDDGWRRDRNDDRRGHDDNRRGHRGRNH